MSKTLLLLLLGFVAVFYHLAPWKVGRQSKPVAVTSATWQEQVHGSLKPVVVYFHKGNDDAVLTQIAPKVAERIQDLARVVTVDLEKNTPLALRYGIQESPTAKIISDGVVVQTLTADELDDEWFVAERIEVLSR